MKQTIEPTNETSLCCKAEVVMVVKSKYNTSYRCTKCKKTCDLLENTTYSDQEMKPVTFEEMQEAVALILPHPIKQINCGSGVFDSLCRLTLDKEVVGNLWGLTIVNDDTLKPNQYKIVKAK